MKTLDIVKIQGWIFELQNVLYDDTAWRRWLLKLISKMGLHTHYDSFFRVWDLAYAPRVHSGQSSFQAAVDEFLIAAGMSRCQVNEIIPALRAQHKTLSADQRPLPGVVETLQTLSATGYQLAVSADNDLDGNALRTMFAKLGVPSCFDFVGTSIDTGQPKPAPDGYRQALTAMNLPAAAVVFVGHDPDHIDGASALGLHTAALDCPPAVSADRSWPESCSDPESRAEIARHSPSGLMCWIFLFTTGTCWQPALPLETAVAPAAIRLL